MSLFKLVPLKTSFERFVLQLSKASKLRMSSNGDGPEAKVLKSGLTIGTHNGVFHCDEVLACFMLKQLDMYKDAQIVRTRDESILSTCDIVVDVGGVFDPTKLRFDHHQRKFNESMKTVVPGKEWITKLSSAGLIYAHYGTEVISKMLNKAKDDSIVNVLFDKLYESFVEEVDAIDNGIATHDGNPRYRVTTTLSSRVSYLNPPWNESNRNVESAFYKALKLVGDEFTDRLHYFANSWWPAREIVQQAIVERKNVDPSGEIIELASGGCPWKEHLFTLEKELNVTPPILYAIFQDDNGAWRIMCVPVQAGSFTLRLPLLPSQQGLRDDELSTATGIPGCIFVHASGFIAGNKTREGALKMGLQTLEQRSHK